MVPGKCNFMRSLLSSDTEEYECKRDRTAGGGGLVGRQGAGTAQEDMGRGVDTRCWRPRGRRQGSAGERTQPRRADGVADRDGARDAADGGVDRLLLQLSGVVFARAWMRDGVRVLAARRGRAWRALAWNGRSRARCALLGSSA